MRLRRGLLRQSRRVIGHNSIGRDRRPTLLASGYASPCATAAHQLDEPTYQQSDRKSQSEHVNALMRNPVTAYCLDSSLARATTLTTSAVGGKTKIARMSGVPTRPQKGDPHPNQRLSSIAHSQRAQGAEASQTLILPIPIVACPSFLNSPRPDFSEFLQNRPVQHEAQLQMMAKRSVPLAERNGREWAKGHVTPLIPFKRNEEEIFASAGHV